MRFTNKALKSNFLSTCERLREGQLILRTPEGERYHFGNSGPEAEMVIRDWAVVSAMAAHGQVGLGETYVQGMWDTSSIETLMTVAMRNRDHLGAYDHANPFNKARFRLADTILRANSKRGARKNIRSHYDVGNEFYGLWLDETMTYSSALFTTGQESLEKAQAQKYASMVDQMGVAPGDHVLEIGCGWGGFAEYAAAERGLRVTCLTISKEQHAYAVARMERAGLSDDQAARLPRRNRGL